MTTKRILNTHYLKLILWVIIPVVLFSLQSCDSESGAKNEKNNPQSADLNEQPQAMELSVDQEAVDIFKGSMDYLHSLQKFSVQAQSTLEDINLSGHRVDYEIASTVVLQRPNKLRTERSGDLYNQVFFYNGKTLTLYNPVQKVYATEAAPGTIDEMFLFAYDKFGISAPVSDLIYSNAFELLIEDVSYAEVIGLEMIGDIPCVHLLFSRPDVDFQIWIADEGTPYPYKYLVTDISTPELLAFSTIMRNWNENPKITDETFNFEAPAGTFKIDFLKVN
ncbi:MAG TPA: DUF2092 domain-containing protein [Bacteroidales bacterium]